MSKSLWLLLLLALTACAPKVSPEVVTQTVRAGDLEVTISAPQWVTRQEFYPVKATFTNKSGKAVNLSDPFDCGYIWGVEEAKTSKVLKPPRQTTYACTMKPAEIKFLAPGESYMGVFSGIISKYPKGAYRIAPQQLQILIHGSLPADIREIRFQIR